MTRSSTASLLLVPATILIVAGVLVPFAYLFRISFNEFRPALFMVEALTLENYTKILTEPYWVMVMANTLSTSLASTLICMLLAFPIGLMLARSRSRFKSLLVMIIVIPLFIGSAVRASGWVGLLGYGGIADTLAKIIGADGSLGLMFTQFAVIIGTASVVIPYIALSVQAGIEGVPPDLESAAQSLGATPSKAFIQTVLPLAAPSILSGTVLVFILCVNSFATPVLLGGPRFKMMGPAIYDQIAGKSNWPFGAALCLVLVCMTLATLSLAFVVRRLFFRRSF